MGDIQGLYANPAMRDIRERFDYADKYGSTMMELFGIAGVLWLKEETVPFDWEYRHGGLTLEDIREDEVTPDLDWLNGLENGLYSPADMLKAGEVLRRYRDLLIRAGKDY